AVLQAGQCYVQEYIPVRTSSPLLAQVTTAIECVEKLRDEGAEVFGCLEELHKRLDRRMAFLREAEQHLRRGGDLTLEARKLVDVTANGKSDAPDARPESVEQSSATGSIALNSNSVPEAH